jgi:hypothetical protein
MSYASRPEVKVVSDGGCAQTILTVSVVTRWIAARQPNVH